MRHRQSWGCRCTQRSASKIGGGGHTGNSGLSIAPARPRGEVKADLRPTERARAAPTLGLVPTSIHWTSTVTPLRPYLPIFPSAKVRAGIGPYLPATSAPALHLWSPVPASLSPPGSGVRAGKLPRETPGEQLEREGSGGRGNRVVRRQEVPGAPLFKPPPLRSGNRAGDPAWRGASS